MKLATTTADFRIYSDKASEIVDLFDGTGFRYLDLNLYRSIYPGSPLLDAHWERWIEDAAEAATAKNMSFCQAHAPDGNPFASGEKYDVFLNATVRSIEVCGRLGIRQIVAHSKDIGGFPSREHHGLNLKRNRDFFSRLFPTMEKTGVRVLVLKQASIQL
ncbi:MAG: hypothetical protein PHH26_07310 [Candidatus Thermoplasmatota archaeon]|nr:hypothetical protein [Candidatus Thermoplasmatota archaeon]